MATRSPIGSAGGEQQPCHVDPIHSWVLTRTAPAALAAASTTSRLEVSDPVSRAGEPGAGLPARQRSAGQVRLPARSQPGECVDEVFSRGEAFEV